MNVDVQDDIHLTHLEDEGLLEVRIPVRWPKMKGRKTLSIHGSLHRTMAEPAVREALVQAHRCQGKLVKGEADSVKALAGKENIDKSQLSKIMRLTSLAPDIQKDILQEIGHWPLTLKQVMQPFPVEWEEQRVHWRALLAEG